MSSIQPQRAVKRSPGFKPAAPFGSLHDAGRHAAPLYPSQQKGVPLADPNCKPRRVQKEEEHSAFPFTFPLRVLPSRHFLPFYVETAVHQALTGFGLKGAVRAVPTPVLPPASAPGKKAPSSPKPPPPPLNSKLGAMSKLGGGMFVVIAVLVALSEGVDAAVFSVNGKTGNDASCMPCATLAGAFARVSAGDTVSVSPGVYTGPNNRGISPSAEGTLQCTSPGDCLVDCEHASLGMSLFFVTFSVQGMAFTRCTGKCSCDRHVRSTSKPQPHAPCYPQHPVLV